MPCSACGSFNSDDAIYCGACGAATQHQPSFIPVARHAVHGFGLDQTVTSNGRTEPVTVDARADTLTADARPATVPSDATRYLCAAVQLDSVLAERVIREIVDEEYKAPPRSPEVDLVQVLCHALSARGRQLMRDVALLVVLIVFLVFVAAGVGLLLSVAIVLLLAWLVIVVEQLVTTYGVVARDLRPGRNAPVAPPPSGSWAAHRLDQIGQYRYGNVTVGGSYNPFVGSGIPIDAWSFALDMDRAAEGETAESFPVHEIHDYVLTRLNHLGLPGVSIDEQVFVDGRDLHGDGRFLPHPLAPPVSHVDELLVRARTAAPEDNARTYICLRVAGWHGQLVLSTFLRFVVTGQNLFIELSHSLLTPILDHYQEVDHLLPQPTLRQFLRIAQRSVRQVPMGLVAAPFALIRAIFRPISRGRRRARQRREITTALRFNYGSISSPRELASERSYQRYFQQLDEAMYSKIVEKRLLEAIVTFLDDKGIDTHDLIERQTTILNEGVWVSGKGTLNAQSVAAGPGARAKARVNKARAASHRTG